MNDPQRIASGGVVDLQTRRADGKAKAGAQADAGANDLGNWRRPAIWGAVVLLLFVVGFGTWAVTAPLDSAVRAPGEIAVESGRKVVEHPEGGRVEEVLVEEGDRVQPGQLLVRLDKAEAQARFDAARSRLDNALARRARLVAERSGSASIDFPDTLLERRDDPLVAEAIVGESDQFAERRASLEGRISVQQQRISQLRERIAGLEAERQSVIRQASLMRDELGGLREIMEKGYYPRIRVLERERELARLEGREGRLRAEIAQARETIGQTRAEIAQIRTSYREQVMADLRETETRVADLRQGLVQARARLDRRYVMAGFTGIVHNLEVRSAGAVVDPGGTVLQIIPEDDALVVQVRVRPTDIDLVQTGMRANVRLTALPQSTTPSLQGKVTRVSAERVRNRRDTASYFSARVTIPAEALKRLGDQQLKSGMPAEVMIQTGERTLAEYIWQPVDDAITRSMIEP
jgi:HlyD family type I secretion membrane fusion protein